MDKENLPSNLEPVVVTAATAADSKPEQMINGPDQSSPLDQLAADTRTRFAVVDLDDADDPREISAQG